MNKPLNDFVWYLYGIFPEFIDFVNGQIAQLCFKSKFASFIFEDIIGYWIF